VRDNTEVQIGIHLPQIGHLADPVAVRAAARAAESLGYSSVWVLDDVLAPVTCVERNASERTVLDPIATLAYVAACTDRIRLGASVNAADWHAPVLLARSLASVDVLSAGRLTIGLGAAEPSFLDAAIATLDAIWAPPPSALAPAQRPRPPILLGGHTPADLDRVGRLADGWNPSDPLIDELDSRWRSVRDCAVHAGRDPDRLRLIVRATVEIGGEASVRDRLAFRGSVAQIGDDLEAVQAAGADELVLRCAGDPPLDEALGAYAALAEQLAVDVGGRGLR